MLAPRMMKRCGTSLSMPMGEADGCNSTGDNVAEEVLVVDSAVVVGPAREIIKHFVYTYYG